MCRRCEVGIKLNSCSTVMLHVFVVVWQTQDDRAEVPNVAVLITDQSSSTGTVQTVNEAFEAQCAGIKIFAIGTRQAGFNLTELQLIASAPHLEWHQWWALRDFSTTSFDDIEIMVDNELCRPEYGRFVSFFALNAFGPTLKHNWSGWILFFSTLAKQAVHFP